ncbi:phosphatidylinositol 3,4,5-trisphosphate-dependent Rac exchanger 1 protein isoform X1 [Arapaima gigas]
MSAGPADEEGAPESGVHSGRDNERQLRLRLCVLNEILNTERDYVGTLCFIQSSLVWTLLEELHLILSVLDLQPRT